MGEWLYNLRSALDYVICATAVHVSGQNPPPSEQRLQYPIYDSEQAWKRNLSRLDPLEDHHREMLHFMQPFAGDADANYLGWVNRMARIDRHRTLVDGTSYLAVIDPVVQVSEGSTASLEWGERVPVDGRADAARITVSPWTEDTQVAVNPRIGIDPEIAQWSESSFWRPNRFTDRLTMIQVFVSGEIATYEYDCLGQSWKEHLLSDDFKAEARARLPRPPIRHPPRRPVDWTPAGPGRPSTRPRFEGRDFPTGAARPDDRSDEDD